MSIHILIKHNFLRVSKVLRKKFCFICHMSIQKKLLQKFWLRITFHMSNVLCKKFMEEILSSYMSNILSKKTIKEILIKTNFLLIQCPLKENIWRNLEFLCVKHPFKVNYRRNFDQKLVFICHMSFQRKYNRNFDYT